MNVRESKRPICPYAKTSKDLLVCLPSRSHLTLMPKGPKPICSPARFLQPGKRNHHNCKKLLALPSGGSKQASEIAEPTSPKVTCAGQIKVRPGRPASSGKNWQTVMEEIERLHESRHTYKRASPSSPLWFKKDVMQFFACLRGIRFDFRCFGAFPSSATSDGEDDDEYEEEEEEDNGTQNTDDDGEAKPQERAMFSKWFMVLEDPQNPDANPAEKERGEASGEDCNMVPPRNALLLMRCRSAPPKSWLQEVDDDDDHHHHHHEDVVADERSSKLAEMYDGESSVEMRNGKKLCTISTEIVKETWVAEGITRDPLSRSRSWKR